ncbi:cupin fold metalloprotein, WbuC family [Izhakiella capsodis]|uniref:Cupin fold metalloprotein, WbuC family n=1 Tax=Izhakiella capsodis TaxID=1367852 RepID=A0A1I4ZLI8_9GAMM|nr:WbuC family cupin fold metalloprotein [Izhakiella capsodis]SFN51037.1 cupin fold metalloprotein, WbuC family [Izhakiella capsodis]
MKHLTPNDLATLSQKAASAVRLRSNLNLHAELSDPVQRLAIAMEPGTYIRPHRHLQTWEVLTPLTGRFVVLLFKDDGSVLQRVVLGEDAQLIEIPAGAWHAVLSLDNNGVIFEVKQGPYLALDEEHCQSWAPREGEAGCDQVVDWYRTASIGERFSPESA